MSYSPWGCRESDRTEHVHNVTIKIGSAKGEQQMKPSLGQVLTGDLLAIVNRSKGTCLSTNQRPSTEVRGTEINTKVLCAYYSPNKLYYVY